MIETTNRIRSELANDRVVCGCMLTEMRTPVVGMVLERAGLDFFIIDMEHGSFSYETANDIIVACNGLRIVPFVRVPGLDREACQKPLDAGAGGLLVPRIETVEQAAEAVDLVRYAPQGSRGVSLRRAHSRFTRPDPVDFTRQANENVMLMVQIETKRGVENLDAISTVPGVDVLFVGPSDLAHSYGASGAAQVEPAIEHVVRTGKSKGIATGIHHGNLAYLGKLVGLGLRLVSVNTEVGVIINGFEQATAAVREAEGKRTSGA